ncbi:glycosyltransferase family 4 protein [Pseudarthrobacter sp. MDT1-22]
MTESVPVGASNPLSVYMAGSEWFGTRAGGLNRYFEDLYSALKAADEVNVSAFAFGEPPPGASTWGPMEGSTFQRAARSVKGPKWEPGMVIDRHFCLYGTKPRKLWNSSPMLVHFQGPWADESAVAGEKDAKVLLKRAFERLRYRNASAYVVLSEEFKGILVDNYSVDAEKVTVIPPGVDLERFSVGRGASSSPNVLCVRRLERRMGIHILLDAWVQVQAAIPEARLTVVGTGSEEAALRKQSEALGLAGSVDFRGRLSDGALAGLYQEAMLTVVPTVSLEGFGLIALESLATGTPPIVTNCGGLPDAVAGFDPSLVVESGNREQLADRIISAVGGRRPSAADCRRHAESFAWSSVAQKHVELYRSIQ